VALKSRFHKGLTAYLREKLRLGGLAVDEQQAQYLLAGEDPFTPPVSGWLQTLRDRVLADRTEIARQWESDHPGQKPFAPGFAEQVREIVLEMNKALGNDGDLSYLVRKLDMLSATELQSENTTIDDEE
jgi:hypothetical protein